MDLLKMFDTDAFNLTPFNLKQLNLAPIANDKNAQFQDLTQIHLQDGITPLEWNLADTAQGNSAFNAELLPAIILRK